MKKIIFKSLILLLACILGACSLKTDFSVSSPDGQITATLKFDKEQGVLNYMVQSHGKEIISASPIGINTDLGDFRSGLSLKKHAAKTIDETYTLPQGKVSTYRNNANELTLKFNKEGR